MWLTGQTQKVNERFHGVNVIRHDQYGCGSVMVWAGTTAASKTDLHVVAGRVTGQYYRDNILASDVVPFARRYGCHFIFQDDNARCHRARIITDYLQQKNITRLPWPALSPDLSPIEHVWDMHGQPICQRQQTPANVQSLLQHCKRNGITFSKFTRDVFLGICYAGFKLV